MKLSQNHKIAVSVASIFMVSLSIMMFLLSGNPELGHNMQANVSGHGVATEGSEGTGDAVLQTYEEYFKESNSMIFSIDSESKFKYLSEDFCELLDADCKELIGKLFFDYVSSKDLPDLASKHAKIVNDTKDIDGIGPYRLMRDHGQAEIFVMMNVHSIVNKNTITEVVFSVKDITKKVEEINGGSATTAARSDLKNGKTSEVIEQKPVETTPAKEDQTSKDETRPGDSRLMVEKISFNVRLLNKLF